MLRMRIIVPITCGAALILMVGWWRKSMRWAAAIDRLESIQLHVQYFGVGIKVHKAAAMLQARVRAARARRQRQARAKMRNDDFLRRMKKRGSLEVSDLRLPCTDSTNLVEVSPGNLSIASSGLMDAGLMSIPEDATLRFELLCSGAATLIQAASRGSMSRRSSLTDDFASAASSSSSTEAARLLHERVSKRIRKPKSPHSAPKKRFSLFGKYSRSR
uniref:Uncharacterized protein n=1 Tax=Calcidiscus leptoporus TaxID=127549 RepID=A0A7S0P7S0_9EUKA|mmetsp:Transcript_9270/g.21538  ORF Transcript_9270/g.21538 Transcript_9270/m.21538 type:complete len:217 (+) Transcript_9270:64-714(+)